MTGFNPFSLTGKTILVTGASSGIGRGIAVTCSKMGANIVLGGRNEARLNETLLEMEGDGHVLAVADLTKKEELESMVDSLPKLDGIVHCAGIGQRILCKQLQESDVDNVMDMNFKAPVLLQTVILKKKTILYIRKKTVRRRNANCVRSKK